MRFTRVLPCVVVGIALFCLLVSCSQNPATPSTDTPQTTIVVPGQGSATLSQSSLDSLQSGEAVVVTLSNGDTYTLRLLSNGTDPDVLEADNGKGVVTYFHNPAGQAGTLPGTWAAYQQKQKGLLAEIVADPQNAITLTISPARAIAIATVGAPVYSPALVVPSNPAAIASLTDSLFAELVKRIQSIDNAATYDEFTALNFASLRDAFNAVIAVQSDNPKANVGCMVSTLLALNTSQSVEKLVDSLDAYYTAVYNQSEPGATPLTVNLMKSSYRTEGIIGLGKAMAAKTSAIALAQTQKPSYPRFVTMSYIQGIAENEVMPALDKAIAAANRLEARSEMSFNLLIPDGSETDTFNLDKDEIYVYGALCHLVRGYIGMYCTYNMDLYAPGTHDYSWYDTLMNLNTNSKVYYSYSGDTLYQASLYDDGSYWVTYANVFKYNLSRPDFLTIRKQDMAQAKTDFLAVASQIKSGLTYIRNKTTDNEKDIIRIASVNSADQNLVDFKTNLIDNGISPVLANKFATPEAIADFVTALLSGPYTFDETIDSTHIQLTVNFASIFDNPVSDLRTLLPHYQWTSENTWLVRDQDYQYVYDAGTENSFYTYASDNAIINIPSSSIARIDSSLYGQYQYYLTTPIHYEAYADSEVYIDPLRLLDQSGHPLTSGQIDSLTNARAFFPVFDDYTFHGLFPGMTRQKWLDLIYQN